MELIGEFLSRLFLKIFDLLASREDLCLYILCFSKIDCSKMNFVSLRSSTFYRLLKKINHDLLSFNFKTNFANIWKKNSDMIDL